MFGITPLILLILPLFFQIIFGLKSVREKFSLRFGTLSLVSFISQIVLSIASYCVALHNFNNYFEEHPNQTKCGMGFLGLIGFAVLLMLALIIVIFIQFLINRYWKKQPQKN